jgi:hypothetical protein
MEMAKFVCENCGRTFKQGGYYYTRENGSYGYFCCTQCKKEGLGENQIGSFIGQAIGGFLNGYFGSEDEEDDDD